MELREAILKDLFDNGIINFAEMEAVTRIKKRCKLKDMDFEKS